MPSGALVDFVSSQDSTFRHEPDVLTDVDIPIRSPKGQAVSGGPYDVGSAGDGQTFQAQAVSYRVVGFRRDRR